MCGICGIIHEDSTRTVENSVIEVMNRSMTHRGPDDEGYFLGRGSALAMRRLSIIDLSGGHQPLFSENDDIVTVCNGELYNFEDQRADLIKRGHKFRCRSDIEIIPHLFQEYGEGFVERVNGMFAIAVWDIAKRTLLLARDRVGKKPLYWTLVDRTFIFGSELKVVLAHPMVERKIDRRSLAKYLAYEYVPAPHTIFEGIHKLEGGHILKYRDGRVTIKQYWDVPTGSEESWMPEQEAARRVRELMESAVKKRLMSDVPLGVFLSGGIDSSSVVAMMAGMKPASEIKTFSIAFAESSFDESSHARRVANYFKTDHREQLFTPEDLLALFPEIEGFLDEPMADPSILPTYALSKFTSEHVKVALGGDGGDELFAGYQPFFADRYARYYRAIPNFIKKLAIEPLARMLPISDENISFDFKVRQFLKGADAPDLSRHILWMGSFSPNELRNLFAFDFPTGIFEDVSRYELDAGRASPGNRMLYSYMKLYLAEDILTKVDRASMGTSLEVRAPLLDKDLIEFVARLPFNLKLKGHTTKYILKKAVGDLLPKGIAGRAKKGFGIPVSKWIKGPLKSLFKEALDGAKIEREGLFNPDEVTRLFEDHISGRADNHKKLWTLYIFERWLAKWGVKDVPAKRSAFR